MTFSDGQKALMENPFSYGNSAHQDLLKQKLAQFKRHHAEMQKEVPHILWSGIGVVAANLTGFNKLLWFIRVDYMIVFYAGLHFNEIAGVNNAYRAAFNDLLAIYDWCFKNPENMPPTDNPDIQTLIQTMGTLVNQRRLEKLEPLVNGSARESSITDYLFSGAKTLGTAALGMWSSGSTAASDILDQPTFAAKVKGYLNGETTSWWNYYIFGEGSQLIDKALSMVGKGQQVAQSAIDAAHTLAPHIQRLAATAEAQAAHHAKPE